LPGFFSGCPNSQATFIQLIAVPNDGDIIMAPEKAYMRPTVVAFL